MKSIIRTVTRGCKTNDEKAIAIYNAGRLFWYHRAYPGEKGGIAALKMINVYGWSLCGGQHAVLTAMWRAAGFDWRYLGWPGHTTVECGYDGKWHYFDTFLKCYAWRADADSPGGRSVASQEDIRKDPDLISKNFVFDSSRRVWYMKGNRPEIVNDKANWVAPAFFVCGDTPPGVISGVRKKSVGGTSNKFGHMGLKIQEDGYNTDVNLAAGYSLELMWKHIDGAHWYNWQSGRKYIPGHTCGDKDYRNCPAIGPVLEPYRYLNPRGARTFSSGYLRFAPDLGSDAFVSSLAGWENLKWSKGQIAPADASKPASITVRLQSPYIMSRAKGAAAGIDTAEISLDSGKKWSKIDLGSETPTVVQKVFSAADLPATLDIPVPTPKGKYAVYPRMLLLRREVIAPGQKPMPLPAGAVAPKVGGDDELKTLPNPFLIGIAPPPKQVARAIVTRKIPLECSHVISRTSAGKLSDEVFENHFLKTRPKNPEAWVMLIGGELKGLPAPRGIKAARLCIPVTNASPNARTQVGASMLSKPFTKMKPYDFKDLGGIVGTVVVPKQTKAGPAKYYKIEVTRGLKLVAAGEAKFHGLAVRVVPNRGVDEGYTVRVDITKDKPTYIELETYADKKAD